MKTRLDHAIKPDILIPPGLKRIPSSEKFLRYFYHKGMESIALYVSAINGEKDMYGLPWWQRYRVAKNHGTGNGLQPHAANRMVNLPNVCNSQSESSVFLLWLQETRFIAFEPQRPMKRSSWTAFQILVAFQLVLALSLRNDKLIDWPLRWQLFCHSKSTSIVGTTS